MLIKEIYMFLLQSINLKLIKIQFSTQMGEYLRILPAIFFHRIAYETCIGKLDTE